ncbi:MAG TPA: hypothetical protein VG388_06880 [Solirubrobacteraceae bacterium]|jgi:hypothetical protein|nr:hypothetical protein [Solirubrobacteraceae bacterium]
MGRWRALAIALLVAIVLIVVLASRSQGPGPAPMPKGPVLHLTAGPGRALAPALMGIDGEAIIGRGVWSTPQFLRVVGALHPQALRVFGGTPANFWNWRTGTYVHSARVPASLSALRAHIRVTLADWARLVRAAGAMPVFDLNMFTSSLRSQLAMLHAASRLGMPIRYVELGNELYMPQYAVRFRDGADYGRVSSRWIAAIRRAFPGVAVAADAYPGHDRNSGTEYPRERRWNSALLRTLRGESALSLHAYFTSGLGPSASLASPVAAATLLRSPARRWTALGRLIARFPPRLKVWVTEWNLFDTLARVHGTWDQGLAVAAFGLELVSESRVVQSDYETLVDSAPFGAIFGRTTNGLQLSGGSGDQPGFRAVAARAPATPPFGLATGGVALRALLGALAGATVSRPLGAGPVHGLVVGGRRGFSAVFVNLSARPYTLPVPSVLRGLPYTEWWGRPITLVAGAASLHSGSGTTRATFGLEPFSLLQIGGAQ